MHRKELWAALIVVVAVTAILGYVALTTIGQVIAFGNSNDNTAADGGLLHGVDTSSWQTYQNPAFGFSVQYPPNWQISTVGLSAANPFIVLGNPLTGTTTYAMGIFVGQNPQSLSSGEYVHQLLSADRTQDAANAKNGPAPAVTPQFTHGYLTTAGTSEAYELYDVFEFDHNAEQIYVTGDTVALRFDFPVADANPNESSPANNNAIAHLIVDTLVFQ